MNKLSVALLTIIALTTGSAQGSSLSLIYNGTNPVAVDGAILVADGDLLTFTVFADFSGPGEITLGGGFDIAYDGARLSVEDFLGYCGAPGCFYRPPQFLDGLIFNNAFGRFNGITEYEPVVVTFEYLGTGGLFETFLTTAATTGDSGPFVSALDFTTIQDVDYLGLTLREVPVPGALWLMLSGLLGLPVLRQR